MTKNLNTVFHHYYNVGDVPRVNTKFTDNDLEEILDISGLVKYPCPQKGDLYMTQDSGYTKH